MFVRVSEFMSILYYCIVDFSSGTEEEYSELCQLLEDIASYVKDCDELKKENGKMRKKKEAEDKQKGEEMRKAAMEGLASKCEYIWCTVVWEMFDLENFSHNNYCSKF